MSTPDRTAAVPGMLILGAFLAVLLSPGSAAARQLAHQDRGIDTTSGPALVPPRFEAVETPWSTTPWSMERRTARVQVTDQGGDWKKGMLIGGGIGVAIGIIVHALIDGLPCDSCTDGGSAAEGAGLEFALLFGLGGAGIGALIAR